MVGHVMIQKVVIPAAGLGTRLFPATKEQPKEMLPVFSRLLSGEVCVKPLVQLVFEQLYDAGFREFCFVVGRGKRSIEDHFTPDLDCVDMLEKRRKSGPASDLQAFYSKLQTSTIVWVNQPDPQGFGDAVSIAHPFVQNENCLVHAGDSYIVSKDAEHLKALMKTFERLNAEVTFLVQEIADPRQHGVIVGEELEKGIYRVTAAVEKPVEPPSKLAILPMYVFDPMIFKALEKTSPGKGGEIQLTDAIQKLVEWDLKVCAVQLNPAEARLDVGNPETYWKALRVSHASTSE